MEVMIMSKKISDYKVQDIPAIQAFLDENPDEHTDALGPDTGLGLDPETHSKVIIAKGWFTDEDGTIWRMVSDEKNIGKVYRPKKKD